MAGVRRGRFERALIVTHRWVGIVLALLMALWSVSGIVMLYVAFPELTASERFEGLDGLELGNCCTAAAGDLLEGADEIVVSMTAGRPVARIGAGFGTPATLDLVSGNWLQQVPRSLAETVAASHLAARGFATTVAETTSIHNDQWTVYQRFNAHRPLYKVTFDGDRGDVIYVSGTTAEVVQDTHVHERFWNWLGAVPHWLYYTAFRERQSLWYQFIVYASLAGTLLLATGLYLGVKRMLEARGRWTRYLGPMRWHHLTGLIFGLLTFTWVISGLFSMNPWGWLESRGANEDLARLQRAPLHAGAINSILQRAVENIDDDTVMLTIASGDSGASVFTVQRDSRRARLDPASFAADLVDEQELVTRLGKMRPDANIDELVLLDTEDAYYFGHKAAVRLPVYRAILDDAERTRYYFDADTGLLLSRIDRPGKQYRWLHHGLHRLDFASLLRSRPIWDIVILPLLIGVSGLCLIGCWIGYRHIRYR